MAAPGAVEYKYKYKYGRAVENSIHCDKESSINYVITDRGVHNQKKWIKNAEKVGKIIENKI